MVARKAEKPGRYSIGIPVKAAKGLPVAVLVGELETAWFEAVLSIAAALVCPKIDKTVFTETLLVLEGFGGIANVEVFTDFLWCLPIEELQKCEDEKILSACVDCDDAVIGFVSEETWEKIEDYYDAVHTNSTGPLPVSYAEIGAGSIEFGADFEGKHLSHTLSTAKIAAMVKAVKILEKFSENSQQP